MQAVFFDLDGTLVELPDDFAALFESALRECGVSADDDHHDFYLDAFFDYLGECHPEPYRMAMADLRAEFDLEPSARALAETYTEREAAGTGLRPGVREVLDALDSTDSALGVLTNGAARCQQRKLEHHGIADHFDAVVISGEVGAGKPDLQVFAAARDAIPADEYVFVADGLERDVLPAQEAGFTGIHFAGEGDPGEEGSEPDGEAPDEDYPDGDRADETVTSLREIPDALDREHAR